MKTSTQAMLREEARQQLCDGNSNFQVMSAEVHDDGTHFIVGLPMAVKRQGVFGRVSPDLGGGPTTKFGNRLFDSLRVMEEVTPSINRNQPYLIQVYIPNTRPASSVDLRGFFHRANGLPADVCVTIQAVILWNRGPGQLFFQYLRGLI